MEVLARTVPKEDTPNSDKLLQTVIYLWAMKQKINKVCYARLKKLTVSNRLYIFSWFATLFARNDGAPARTTVPRLAMTEQKNKFSVRSTPFQKERQEPRTL